MSIKEPEFTSDWFTQNIPVWEQVLAPLRDKPIKAIEIGSYEGRSALWLLQNILTHDEAELTVVDTWDGGGELKDIDWDAVKERFTDNTADYQHKMMVCQESSTDFLRRCEFKADLIYIDGGHFAPQALIDSVLAHLLLKPEGIIIFDDYLIGGLLHTPITPKTAIDAFMECFAQQYEWLSIGYQVVLRKKPILTVASPA